MGSKPAIPNAGRWLAVARRAAAEGVRRLRAQGARGRRERQVQRRDVKIAADAIVDRAVIRYLQHESPFPLLTEESGVLGNGDDHGGARWIIDPVDGSFNYSRQIPLCAVSIALWLGEVPVLGVVHDPIRNEVFSGVIGVGAWLNGRPMSTSPVRRIRDAVLCTGFPVAADFSTAALGTFVRGVRDFKKVRLFGTAALSLAYVASGRADVYAEREIKIWDVAAGLAIVCAAGGRAIVKPGRQAMTRVVVASNGRLSGAVLSALSSGTRKRS